MRTVIRIFLTHVLFGFFGQLTGNKAPFIWRKRPGRRVTLLPELFWASQLFIFHFLSKLGDLHKRQKVDSA